MSLLTCEDAESLGRLWTVSHEGDRVTLPQGNGQRMAFSADVSDARLETLIGELRSSDPETAHAAHLHRQPGVYACSTPRIDHIVDLALPMPGVTGAQMAGAGLGGCVMILVHSPHAGDLVRLLESQGFAAKEYHPVKGAEVLKV
jgi:N-acetylgalactosamine kinase